MKHNHAYISGFDFGKPISDEKVLKLQPPAKDTTPTTVEITRDCYINGKTVNAGNVVMVDRDDALIIEGSLRGKIIE